MELPLVPVASLVPHDDEICRRIPLLQEIYLFSPNDPLYGPPFRYFLLFSKWPFLLTTASPMSAEAVFYNEYYWFLKLIRLWQSRNGPNAGMEQQAFKLFESAHEHRGLEIDLSVLEQIEQHVSREVEAETI